MVLLLVQCGHKHVHCLPVFFQIFDEMHDIFLLSLTSQITQAGGVIIKESMMGISTMIKSQAAAHTLNYINLSY